VPGVGLGNPRISGWAAESVKVSYETVIQLDGGAPKQRANCNVVVVELSLFLGRGWEELMLAKDNVWFHQIFVLQGRIPLFAVKRSAALASLEHRSV